MADFDEDALTAAVLASVAHAPAPRVREIGSALVRHLHAFVREIEPTQAEWTAAIDFLTRAGRLCSSTRQEFILLSDVLGVSMLVDTINHRLPDGATATTVLGPFYVEAAPEVERGARIASDADGPPLWIEGRVADPAGRPLADAVVDVWHADDRGFYDVQKAGAALTGRARVRTDATGLFWLRSTVPAAYPIPDDGPVGQMLRAQGRHPYRPAHVHFMIAYPGFRTLVTHLFLAGSDYLESDVVFGVKDALVSTLGRAEAGTTRHGVVLAETMALLQRDFVIAPQGGDGPIRPIEPSPLNH